MIQEVYIPKNSQLRQIIRFLYYGEFTNENSFAGTTAIFPNATTNLTVVLDHGIDFNQSQLDNAIYATCSSTVLMDTQVGSSFMSAQFNSYGMYFLTGTPVDEVQDNLMPLHYFFKESAIRRLREQLKSATSLEARFRKLECFLLETIQPPEVDPRLPFGVSMINRDPNLKMDDLSAALCLTNRGMQKLFKKYVGMSPAYFKKIKRFNHAAKTLLEQPDVPLTSTALNCGYYDQAHFIKDFKHFGQITPSHFLKLRMKSSDFYNYNLKEIENLTP
ncbi:MAG: helix-turn-helix domain-containing protein [Fulvivirga sp.]